MNALHYAVEAADLNAHLFRVTLTIPQPTAEQTVSLPVWIPGSYMVREFSKQLSDITAMQNGTACVLEQTAKGLNYHQIGENLFISPKTVRKHIENIYAKLQVHNKMEAVQKAVKNRIIEG